MTFAVTVTRADFQQALKLLSKFVKPKQGAQAVLSLTDDILAIETPGCTASVPASGVWTGTVNFPSPFLIVVARAVLPDDPVPLSVSGDRIHIGHLSTGCTVQEGAPRRILEVSLNAQLDEVLAARLAYSDEEVLFSGQLSFFETAEQRRDLLIQRAAEILKPLGIERQDLLALVQQSLRRRNAP